MTEMGPTPDAPARVNAWPRLSRALSLLVLLFLYLLGLGHWTLFFNWGDIAFTRNEDWSKEYDYYVILQEALRTRRVPYHMSKEYQKTDKFLGLPESNLSPQILLLPYLGIGRFLWLNALLLYSLGYAGCLLIRRRYRLGPAPFALLFLLFGFNGFITSHLAVGHSMWLGYFLLPFAALYVLELLGEDSSFVPALKLALVLLAMMLQGSLHQVIWVWMLLILLVAFNPRYWKQGALALAFSGWLSFFRLLPAAVTFGGRSDRGFWAGYPTLTEVLDGFIGLHDRTYPGDDGWTHSRLVEHYLHWWEYDMYVGLLGLAALVVFGIYFRFRAGPALERCRYRELDAPLLVLAFLSLNYFYLVVANLPIPLLNAEGVSSRFLIMPVLMLLVISAIRMQRLLEGVKMSAALVVLLVGGLLQTAFSLAEHSYMWKIKPAQEEVEPTIRLISESPERWYVASIWLSALVSLVGMLAWLYVFLRARRSPDSWRRRC
ncbi:MAG TPA: hypothetical protein VKA46_33140 [Gemmataceae bacterium]|nr:hypothetical protein [Gemmataceae bacterium]